MLAARPGSRSAALQSAIRMSSLAILLAAALPQAPLAPQSGDRDLAIAIEADGERAGERGPAGRVRYVADFAGTLHLWVSAPEGVDPCLRVETAQGELAAEDEDAGGGATPCARIEVSP